MYYDRKRKIRKQNIRPSPYTDPKAQKQSKYTVGQVYKNMADTEKQLLLLQCLGNYSLTLIHNSY